MAGSSRSSMYTTATATASTSHTSSQATKQRQIAHLAGRLAELTKRVDGLDKQVEVASRQAHSINQLGASHAAL